MREFTNDELTAFVMGECNCLDAEEVQAAMLDDQELAAKVSSMSRLIDIFADRLTEESDRTDYPSSSTTIDRFFIDVEEFAQQLEDFDSQIDPDAEPYFDWRYAQLSQCIHKSLESCRGMEIRLESEDPIVLKELQSRYRDALWPWISKSWCFNRSITKPRGYPGDYQLLSAIYDDQPRSTGLGGYLDLFWLNLTLSRAVIGRMLSMREFLNNEFASRCDKISVLNVACGACRELTQGLLIPGDNVVILSCVDNDQEALDHVRYNVCSQVPENMAVDFVRYNALRMTSAAGTVGKFGHSDIIYSAGLCDYIPDEYLIPLLKGWRESLAEGGVVYVAFNDALRYDKTEYQWLMDWYFFQRTEEEYRQLFERAGYDLNQIEVSRDRTGTILNFACRTATSSSKCVHHKSHQIERGPHLESRPLSRFNSHVN